MLFRFRSNSVNFMSCCVSVVCQEGYETGMLKPESFTSATVVLKPPTSKGVMHITCLLIFREWFVLKDFPQSLAEGKRMTD